MIQLLISDLHLTDNPRDSYRWGLFPWLAEKKMQGAGVHDVFILGDITDAKDHHSAKLVNKIVDAVVGLYRSTGALCVHILRGNHDGYDPDCPYFRFLGKFPFVKFYEVPFLTQITGFDVLMLPHSRFPERDWVDVPFRDAELILMHATVKDAVSESGVKLDGVSPKWFARCSAKIYSGDVHVPQKVGAVEYVGAPYPIRFGDKFTPRCVLLDKGKIKEEWHYPTIQRLLLTISHPDELAKSTLNKGDQVKVQLKLGKSQFVDWAKHKKRVVDICAEAGVELCDIELAKNAGAVPKIKSAAVVHKVTSQETLAAYCKENKVVEETAEAGIALLEAKDEAA